MTAHVLYVIPTYNRAGEMPRTIGHLIAFGLHKVVDACPHGG